MKPLVAILVIAAWQCAGAGAEPRVAADSEDAAPADGLRVLDVVIVSSNRVTVGTNALSLAHATNLLARMRDSVDVVAVHGTTAESAAGGSQSAAGAIARAGLPMVLVEKEGGAYGWRERTDGSGVRTLSVKAGQLANLKDVLHGRKGARGGGGAPAVQTSVRWDAATGSLSLNRMELGLFGEHVWLVGEQTEGGEGGEAVGIQFKKEW